MLQQMTMSRLKHKSTLLSAYDKAIQLLARREHSQFELNQKLIRKGYSEEETAPALESLVKKGWLSDYRFTEAWIRHRIRGGFGRLKILSELNQKGIAPDLASNCIQQADVDWFALALKVRLKKYPKPWSDYKEKAKQYRYMLSRGFEHDQIQYSFETQPSVQDEP